MRSRRPLFLDGTLVGVCRQQILRAAAQTSFEITAYCFMPDHLHLLVAGMRDDSHLAAFVKRAKQLSSFHAGQAGHPRMWQDG